MRRTTKNRIQLPCKTQDLKVVGIEPDGENVSLASHPFSVIDALLRFSLTSEESYREKDYEAALKKAFLGTDQDLLADKSRDTSGCTAIAALLTNDNKIYVANAGDSRSVIGTKGKVKDLSFDHKPTADSEM
ncbi:hypothetical protein GALMADRAFT_1340827 [Galerina marginata CBS 339.88]|uniref:protein-serine/threonine phosphatase n=1 Tax=Galerina marginata (strain CBS 339.88) TaxID=685588 RepID=A0A067TZ97_GALM3|nr:hypothetical protein GALMADRAFT_1340827 [Galerina marginata CBS 339.88]